jgi:hypothetical protein
MDIDLKRAKIESVIKEDTDYNLNLGDSLIYGKDYIDYCIKIYGMDLEKVNTDFNNFFAIYVILLFHYLRRVKLYDYCLR